MLKKTERIPHSIFVFFLKKGKRVNTENFILIWTKHHETLISVVVSKKVTASAVERNTIKRRILSSIKKYFLTNSFRQNMALIVIVKSNYTNLTRKESGNAFKSVLGEVFK